jgi:hypothetical protein
MHKTIEGVKKNINLDIESKVLLEGIYDRFFEDEFKAYDEDKAYDALVALLAYELEVS